MKYVLVFFFVFLISIQTKAKSLVQILPSWDEEALQNIQITLPSSRDLKMSIFKRNAYTYFILQSKEDLRINQTDLNDLPIAKLEHPSALILRGVFPENTTPTIYTEKNNLRIKIAEKNNDENDISKWIPDGLLLELKDVSIIDFKDPNTLENFIVFLTPSSPIFMQEKYDTPEMTFLPTLQGIAIYLKTSNFHIQKDNKGFVIHPQNKKSIKNSGKNDISFEKIDWKAYDNLSSEKILQEIQNLKKLTSYLSDAGKQKIYFEMSKFYLSQSFAEPALEVLQLLTNAKIKNQLIFLALILKEDPQKALAIWHKIHSPSFTLALWKNSIDDERLFKISELKKITLSPKMAFVFWKNIAQKAIKQNRFVPLVLAVDNLEKLSLNSYQKTALIYFKGQIAEKEKEPERAIEIYTLAEKLPLSEQSGKILFSKINLEIQTQKITIDEAISKLEKIRPLIVSTDQEIPFLQKLSELYESKNDTLRMLYTERQLLSLTQNDDILKKMQEQFEQAFMAQKKIFNRIAIYNTFKELMPTGIKATRIKQQLIDDFVDADLLKEAYNLAMETIPTAYGKTRQNVALRAYLIAILLSDTEKQKKAEEYLPENWQGLPLPDDLPEILKWVYQKQIK